MKMIREQEIQKAIVDIEKMRGTHIQWAEYFEGNPDIEGAYIGTGEWDSAKVHRDLVKQYDNVLNILKFENSLVEDFIQNRFGYCFYEIKETSAVIYNLYVHPEYRLQGKSQMLLRHVINEIRYIGYNGEIEIETLPRDNINLEKLKSFYERMGFKVI